MEEDIQNFLKTDSKENECLDSEGFPFWLTFLIIFTFVFSKLSLSILGLLTGRLAKKEAKRIEEEYENNPEDDIDVESLDDEARRELEEMYDVVPDYIINKHYGYDTVSTLQSYRNSLTQIEEENEPTNSIEDICGEDFESEIDSVNGDIIQNGEIAQDKILNHEEFNLKEEDVTLNSEKDLKVSNLNGEHIPYIDEIEDSVSDSEASVRTVIEVSKAGVAKVSTAQSQSKPANLQNGRFTKTVLSENPNLTNGEMKPPAVDPAQKSPRPRFLPKWQSEGKNLGLSNDPSSLPSNSKGASPRIPRGETNWQGIRGRSPRLSLASATSTLSQGSSGGWHESAARSPRLSLASGTSCPAILNSDGRSPRFNGEGKQFVYPPTRRKSKGTLEETYSVDSTADSTQDSIVSETSINFRDSLKKPDLKRTNSANKAAFVLRLLSRPGDFEDGIKEFRDKRKEIRSPTGRKISEFNKNRLSVPDVVLTGRSLSNTSNRSYDGKDTLKRRRTGGGEEQDRNFSLETMLTGTVSRMLARKYENAIRRGSNISEA